MEMMPVKYSPDSLFFEGIDQMSQSDNVIVKHGLTRVVHAVATPVILVLSMVYNGVALAVKTPLILLRYTIGFIPTKDGRVADYFPEDSTLKHYMWHAYKICFIWIDIVPLYVVGLASPSTNVFLHRKLGIISGASKDIDTIARNTQPRETEQLIEVPQQLTTKMFEHKDTRQGQRPLPPKPIFTVNENNQNVFKLPSVSTNVLPNQEYRELRTIPNYQEKSTNTKIGYVPQPVENIPVDSRQNDTSSQLSFKNELQKKASTLKTPPPRKDKVKTDLGLFDASASNNLLNKVKLSQERENPNCVDSDEDDWDDDTDLHRQSPPSIKTGNNKQTTEKREDSSRPEQKVEVNIDSTQKPQNLKTPIQLDEPLEEILKKALSTWRIAVKGDEIKENNDWD